MRKKSSHHTLPANVPVFDVMLVRRAGSPSRPGKDKIVVLFERTWKYLPIGRRPDLQGLKRVAVDVLIVDDAEIEKLNAAHLKERGPTDVLSFPMGETDFEREAFHLGEVVVSFETAQREARARNIALENELGRYCIHGFLHLLGYEDATATQQKEMFEIQEKGLLER
jgi:probable rRNA maturation factor